ncbi:MAG: hypothetical protein ABGW97_09775 [Christiangramia sp.]|uniref:hypothetical protein n=1 Tax=Christiangramia sp. TaxID=1931228 RepID=UPI0032420CB7
MSLQTDNNLELYKAYQNLSSSGLSNHLIAQGLKTSRKQLGYIVSQYSFETNLEYHIAEQDGSYFFEGEFYLSRGVLDNIPKKEIAEIFDFTRRLVQQHNGIDYLQTFYSIDQDCKLFFIDNLNREMIESNNYRSSDNYATLLLSSEY